jgi:hypothetical protein
MSDTSQEVTMEAAVLGAPKKATLSEIMDTYRKVLFEIDDAEGVLEDGLEEALTAAEGALVDKVDRVLWVAAEAAKNAELYKERAQALADRGKRLSKESERLKEYVHGTLLTLGVKRLETAHYVATVAESPPSLGVLEGKEEELLELLSAQEDCFEAPLWVVYQRPPRGLRVKLELDKKALLEDLKKGECDEFKAYLWIIKDRTNLRVR